MRVADLKVFLIPFLLVIFLVLFYGRSYPTARVYLDEFHFIRKGFYYDLFFVQHDLKDSRWTVSEEPRQPKIGTYIYGFNLHLHGIRNVEQHLKEIDFENTRGKIKWWERYWGKSISEMPQELSQQRTVVILSRKVAVAFTIGALLLAYLFLNLWIGSLWAAGAVLLISINPLMVYMGNVVTTDSMQLFFFFAALFVLSKVMKTMSNISNNKLAIYSMLIGLSITGAVGVKVSGIIIFLATSIFYFLLGWIHKSKLKKVLISYAIVLITFCATFTYLHPYLYSNPPTRFIELFTDRLAGADRYRLEMPGSALETRIGALQRIFERTLAPNGNYVNFYLFGIVPIDLLLCISGIAVMLQSVMRSIKNF